MGRVLLFALMASLLTSCDTWGVFASTQVRVENASSLTFDAVSYWAGNEEVSYSTLRSGAATPYVDAGQAYGYTTVQVVVETDTLRLQVIDYVGESHLGSGRYTYLVGLTGPSGSRSLTQDLRRDP